MSEMLISGTGLYKVLGGIGLLLNTMSVGKLVTGLVQAAMAAGSLAAMSAGAASALTLGVATLAIAGGVALIMNGINSAADQATARATKTVQPTNNNHANGGIVGGNSLAGDNVKINANSGEMVLNRNQQAKLFNMINNGGGNGNPVQVTSNLILDGKTFALAVANVERTNSNLVGSARQESNRLPQ